LRISPAFRTLSEAKKQLDSLGGPFFKFDDESRSKYQSFITAQNSFFVLTTPSLKRGYSEDELLACVGIIRTSVAGHFGVKQDLVEVNPGSGYTRF